MSKIGICACYNTLNYGSMLQSYATQYYIESLGYDSEFIVYRKKKDLLYCIKSLPRLINKSLFHDKYRQYKKKLIMRFYPSVQEGESIRKKAFMRFEKEYYSHFSEPYCDYNDLQNGSKKYDTVLCGSDQLWLPGGLSTNFYNLMFVPDYINKVSYATSFGVSEIPWYQRNRTKDYLNRINCLSVREVQGAKIIKKLTNRDALVVVDPTMLLEKADWDKVIPNKRVVDGPYIFCYFLGANENHRKIAENIKNLTNYPIVTTPFLDNFVKHDLNFGDRKLYDVGPDDFVNLIRNAEVVLTDSFHGTVFSIIYHKRFVTFNRFNDSVANSRNSRIDSLCSKLMLQGRRYDNKKTIEEIAFEKIDFEKVDSLLKKIREESTVFLKNSLSRKVQ